MGLKEFILRMVFPNTYSSDAYIRYLRTKRIDIGRGCIFYSPNSSHVDVQRPHLLHIGDFVKVTHGVQILCHDYSRSVLCNMEEYGNVGEAKKTWIGDNVFIGVNSVILMGSHIGDNTIIGAGSVVSGSFEDNVVISGNPARVLCSLDDFYHKRKQREVRAAKEYVKAWREKYDRDPTITEMTNAFSWLYLPRNSESIQKYKSLFNLNGIDRKKFEQSFLDSTATYNSFEDFLEDCDL